MKNKNRLLSTLKEAQKNIISQVNAIATNKEVQRTLKTAQAYGQKVAHNVVTELQKRGKITAVETKKIMKEVHKRSHAEKNELYKNLKKDSERLLSSMRNVVIDSLALAKKYASLDSDLLEDSKIKRKK